ncbi:kin of IRRE-like protein 2 [Strongylocentrotus purpuratus]|uniref:Ig-like domain-containing protein n=1 Tax=Strongylocentrotus purpuratus TaxID=7668 RepID=A0A7M7PAP1_STRPU|nr:kin of IRRE-like protein 2 [Strongylocentrotus purpuratus]
MAVMSCNNLNVLLVSKALIMLHLALGALCQTAQFTVQPRPVAVLEGRAATMDCSISNLNARHVVLWYRGGILLSNGTAIVGHQLNATRYSIMVNTNSGQYNLHIRSVSKSDDHSYLCAVQSISAAGVAVEVLRSRSARLEIYHLPDRKRFPLCEPLTKLNYTEGEFVTILCKSERANPPVTLKWTRNGILISQVEIDDTVTTGYRTLRHRFQADASLNGASFECHASSEADDTYAEHCVLDGLNILYKPRVSLDKINEAVHADEEFVFQCIADANPEPSHYFWKRSPEIPAERVKFSQDKTQMMINPRDIDNGTLITCNVSNAIGSLSSSLLMIVQPVIVETTTPKSNDSTVVTIRPKTSTDIPPYKPDVGSSASETVPLSPEILAIIIGIIGLLILIVLVITLGYLCRCFPVQHKGSYDNSVYGSTFGPNYGPNERPIWDQTSIYFEPKDHLRELNTWQRTHRPVWQRNVSVQVPHVEEEDPPYQEIGQDWDDGTYTMQI